MVAALVDVETFLGRPLCGTEPDVFALADRQVVAELVELGWQPYLEDDTVTVTVTEPGHDLRVGGPVIEVTAATIDGVEVDSPAAGDMFGTVRFPCCLRAGQVVTVTVTHGWQTVPDDVAIIAAAAVAGFIRRQASVAAMASTVAAGVTGKTVGRTSVQFAQPTADTLTHATSAGQTILEPHTRARLRRRFGTVHSTVRQ